MKLLKSIENLRMSVRSIASNKIRSFLTALGVMIGVGAVIALVALGNGAQVSVQQSLESLGSNLLIVYSGQPRGSSLVRRNTSNIVPVLTADDVAMVAGLGPDLVTRIAPENTSTSQIKFENLNTVATVSGTTEAYPAIRNFYPAHGLFISTADVESRRAVAVIGAQIYRDLFPAGGDPVGLRVRIDGVSFTIVGIMQEKGSAVQDTSVFIPVSTFQRYISGGNEYASLNIQAASTEVMQDLQFVIEHELLKLHRLPSMELADFYVANQLDLLGTAEGVAGTFTLLLGSIAAISLLVGGIGIMNIMLVSVTERTREIGVRIDRKGVG